MLYHELVISILLQNDIPIENANEVLAKFIAKAMLEDRELKKLHEQKVYKPYHFCGLYPIEQDKVYHKGRIYLFHIRSVDVQFILKLKRLITVVSDPSLKIMSVEIRQQPYRFISTIHSMTPAVCTVDNRCWVPEDGLGLIMRRIHDNAVKKYRNFYGELEEPQESFIESVELLNQKPIRIRYKKTSILGCKLCLSVKPDDISQKLAFMVMGSGLLEKNALGFGYCRAK